MRCLFEAIDRKRETAMNRENYQRRLEERLAQLKGSRPRLLLHACCAPCSTYVLEYLTQYFAIDVFFYNPNIHPREEFLLRRDEAECLCGQMGAGFLCPGYESERFFRAVQGMEAEPEGGRRCKVCYRLRLEETCKRALEGAYDFFTTTLTISPLKNAETLNKIGRELEEQYGVAFLPSDFKKKGGYQRSLVLSREYGLYRQNYCGCCFSRRGDRASEGPAPSRGV